MRLKSELPTPIFASSSVSLPLVLAPMLLFCRDESNTVTLPSLSFSVGMFSIVLLLLLFGKSHPLVVAMMMMMVMMILLRRREKATIRILLIQHDDDDENVTK